MENDEMIRIGLDIGITSVGWAVMACDENGEPKRIVELGSRIFDAAEKPKDGGSLAADRRDARGMRRRLRRKGERLRRLRALFAERGVCIDFEGEDANMLRLKGLDEELSKNDFARVLYLLCKNRGFKSNKRANKVAIDVRSAKSQKDDEDGKLLEFANANEQLMISKNYRTVGEMLYAEYVSRDGKWHNIGGDYSHTVYRKNIRAELETLFEAQRAFGNPLADEEFETKYFEIFEAQRSFDMGPGKGSKYSAEYKVGDCPFEEGEKRCPKASFSFEWSRALEKLNNVKIVGEYESRALYEEERKRAAAKMRSLETFSFHQLRRELGLSEEERFNLAYPRADFKALDKKIAERRVKGEIVDEEAERYKFERESRDKFEKKELVCSLRNSNSIRNALEGEHKKDDALVDGVAELLSYSKSEEKRRAAFASGEYAEILSEGEISSLIEIDCDKFGMLSLKALKKIIPHLETGLKYSDAIQAAGYSLEKTGMKREKLLGTEAVQAALDDINVPVVKRAVSQTVKVVNAIIRKYGSPLAISVELARDLAHSKKERDKIDKSNKDRNSENERIKERIRSEFHIEPKPIDIVKYRLYEEQGGKCVYSGEPIDPNRLFGDNFYQIDHVMPFSRSFNDSYQNKVLVLTRENQNKGNKLPFEYMSEQQFAEFETRVRTFYAGNQRKREILLKKKLDEKEWKSSALNDTGYISRVVSGLLGEHLLFDARALGEKRVFTYSGGMTAYVRKHWGIEKIRSDGDLHHAVDAAMLACMTDAMSQRIALYNQNKETHFGKHVVDGESFDPVTGESFETMLRLPLPYANFRKELIARTQEDAETMRNSLESLGYSKEQVSLAKPATVSRMPMRGMKGKIHKETLRSAKYIDEGLVVSKTPLEKLKLDKSGEIDGYFKPESDMPLYELLKSMLQAAGGNGETAFKDKAVFKPRKDGTQGPRVYKVKTFVRSTSGVLLKKNGAIADNDNMCRVDVFTKDGKFYLVPVYVSDVYAGRLPMKAATALKPEEEWRDISNGYDFLFSLHKNDMIFVENKKGMKLKKMKDDEKSKLPKEKTVQGCFGYFNSFGRATAQIKFEDINGCYEGIVGSQNLKQFAKYEVDVLGEAHLVGCEKRQPLHRPRS